MNLFGLDSSEFMPHGHCVLWREEILWPMVGSDLLIFASYSAIPFGLYVFYKKRTDISPGFTKLLILFVLFIQLCGLTHLISAYNYWHAEYHIEVILKIFTAIVSCLTAYVILKNLKRILLLPSPAQYRESLKKLQELNHTLEEKVAEQTREIESQKNYLESIIEVINDALIEYKPIRNEEGEIIDFSCHCINDKVEQELGLSQYEVNTESVLTDQAQLMNSGRFELLKEVYTSGKTFVFDPSDIQLNNRLFKGTYTKNHRDDSVLLTASNVTEREELKLQAISASRLSALGELAGGVAHEINTPLQIILGASRKLKRQLDTSNCDDSLNLIDNTVKRVSKIVKNLKRLSHGNIEEYHSFSIIEFLDGICDISQQRVLDAEIQFQKTYKDQEDFTIYSNEVALSQIVINLLNNSIDELSDLNQKEKIIEIKTYIDDENFVLEINDNGKGMSEEVEKNIFNPFFTTKPTGVGTGLGLSLCKRLADAMGATIDLTQDDRTRFRLTLPKRG